MSLFRLYHNRFLRAEAPDNGGGGNPNPPAAPGQMCIRDRAEAMEASTPFGEQAETAKGEIDQAEGRIKTAETNAETSAKNALSLIHI